MCCDCFKFGVQTLLVTLMLVHVSSKKMCLWRHSTYHLKAHRISTQLHKQERKKKEVIAIAKFVTTFSVVDL